MYYDNLYQMCGYSQEEIEEQRPRIENFLKRVQADNEEAIKHAEETTNINFDVSLAGTRKFLRLFMKECIDAALAKEEYDQVIYVNLPNFFVFAQPINYAIKEQGLNVFSGPNDWCWQILGPVFDKANWLIESGELMGQTAGRAHCSHYQVTAGLFAAGVLDKPDLVIAARLFCDQSGESDEMTSQMFDFPIVNVDFLNDFSWDAWPNFDEHGVEYVKERILDVYRKIKDITGVDVKEHHIIQALEYGAKLTMGWQNIVGLMAKADPQPVSQGELTLPFYTWSFANHYEKEFIDAFNTLMKDIHKKIRKGEGILPKGAPKVYTMIRTNCDLTPMKEIEKLGLAMPAMFFDWLPSEAMEGRFDDVYMIIAEAMYRVPIFGGPMANIDYWEKVAKMHNVDGIIMMYAFACRPWCIPPLMAKRELQERLGIPVLVVEGDSWDTRNYSAGQLRTRVESFAEVLKMRKAAQAA